MTVALLGARRPGRDPDPTAAASGGPRRRAGSGWRTGRRCPKSRGRAEAASSARPARRPHRRRPGRAWPAAPAGTGGRRPPPAADPAFRVTG